MVVCSSGLGGTNKDQAMGHRFIHFRTLGLGQPHSYCFATLDKNSP